MQLIGLSQIELGEKQFVIRLNRYISVDFNPASASLGAAAFIQASAKDLTQEKTPPLPSNRHTDIQRYKHTFDFIYIDR
jgi:hypothetical protein